MWIFNENAQHREWRKVITLLPHLTTVEISWSTRQTRWADPNANWRSIIFARTCSQDFPTLLLLHDEQTSSFFIFLSSLPVRVERFGNVSKCVFFDALTREKPSKWAWNLIEFEFFYSVFALFAITCPRWQVLTFDEFIETFDQKDVQTFINSQSLFF